MPVLCFLVKIAAQLADTVNVSVGARRNAFIPVVEISLLGLFLADRHFLASLANDDTISWFIFAWTGCDALFCHRVPKISVFLCCFATCFALRIFPNWLGDVIFGTAHALSSLPNRSFHTYFYACHADTVLIGFFTSGYAILTIIIRFFGVKILACLADADSFSRCIFAQTRCSALSGHWVPIFIGVVITTFADKTTIFNCLVHQAFLRAQPCHRFPIGVVFVANTTRARALICRSACRTAVDTLFEYWIPVVTGVATAFTAGSTCLFPIVPIRFIFALCKTTNTSFLNSIPRWGNVVRCSCTSFTNALLCIFVINFQNVWTCFNTFLCHWIPEFFSRNDRTM